MNYVLTIAGFDPSNGAGLTADIKTLEAHDIYGLSVCTAVTIQHESAFRGVDWIKKETILKQIAILAEQYRIDIAKIGLIEDFAVLNEVIDYLKAFNPEIKIIWDPILKASAGFRFHGSIERITFTKVAKKCYLITPNQEEWAQLFGPAIETAIAKQYTNILLKGGHARGELSTDTLFEVGEVTRYSNQRLKNDKHGTGCVLSAAIVANLAQGYTLKRACEKAKAYVTRFLESTDLLLGKHNYN